MQPKEAHVHGPDCGHDPKVVYPLGEEGNSPPFVEAKTPAAPKPLTKAQQAKRKKARKAARAARKRNR
jgi:hypothetical protein